MVERPWIDEATGLPSTAVWALILSVEAARCQRYGRTATVVAIDIEDATKLSIVWGREVLGRAGQAVASALVANLRSSDYLTRADDGTFLALLPETDEVAAINFVERIRPSCDQALCSLRVPGRCLFGWADARAGRNLVAAAVVARERLSSDVPGLL